jgi:hypothetical protein
VFVRFDDVASLMVNAGRRISRSRLHPALVSYHSRIEWEQTPL